MKLIIKHAAALKSIISKLEASENIVDDFMDGKIDEEKAEEKILDLMEDLALTFIKILPARRRISLLDGLK